jgi:dihydrofolate synthase/folylpolyglutamate synthase
MTYEEATAFWYGRVNYEVKSASEADLKLERMRALLKLLGDPHDRLRIVHVTGTKGKGSTAAMMASVLRCAGYRVGLFTSPHLVDVEERIQVNGVPITRPEFAARMAEVAAAVRKMDAAPFPPPTFFEIGTALGFLHFVCRRVDVAVVEVGLGGRFDSTNVCRPLVSVITCIGLDHTAQLGNTLEAIAHQKAGIIKPRVPVVSGEVEPGPRAVIERVARETGSRLVQAGRDFGGKQPLPRPLPEAERGEKSGFLPLSASGRGLGGGVAPPPRSDTSPSQSTGMTIGLLGAHQQANAAVAVATLHVLRASGMPVPDAAVAKGLAEVRWPARIEVVSRNPTVILDCAHNVPSAEALVRTLWESVPVGGRKAVVFAVSLDKQYPEMLRILAGYFDHFHLCRYGNNPRCVPPEALAEVLREVAPESPATVHASAAEAWAAARSAAGPDDLVCVTGSVFLAGELQAMLRAGHTEWL